MKKSLKYYIIVWIALVGLFNIVCFVTPDEVGGFSKFTGSFWAGYGFVMAAFVLHLIYACFALNEANAEKRILNTPLTVISFIELLLMIIVGTLCIAVFRAPTWVGIILCYLVLMLSVIFFISAKAVGENAQSANISLNQKTSNFRELVDDAQQLITASKTKETRELSQKVYDALRYSDMVSSAATVDDEAAIQEKLRSLIADVSRDPQRTDFSTKVDDLLALIEIRNNKCKAAKRRV